MNDIDLRLGDCLEILPTIPNNNVGVVITDPPYPDKFKDGYKKTEITVLLNYQCKQLIFWSAIKNLPLDYSAIHIWDKARGRRSPYERIFERNGNKLCKVFRHLSINSKIAAQIMSDEYNEHPGQKPRRLMIDLIEAFTKVGDTVLDPFMGSGTTGVACVWTGRPFIGIEIDPGYFEIAQKRIAKAQLQIRMGI